ncbi:MAG TPA: DUF2279 domain-containing protein [Methylomirabilota bacterium]
MGTYSVVVSVVLLCCLIGSAPAVAVAPPILVSPPASPDDVQPPPIPSAGLSLGDGVTSSLGVCDPSRLALSYERPEHCRLVRSQEPEASPPERPDASVETRTGPNPWIDVLIAGLTLGGSAANSFTDGPHKPYHFTQEGWFGETTYAGGSDKASHFVSYYVVSKELTNLYRRLGHSERESLWLGFGVAAAAGLVTEIGDGTTRFGFSYEDLVMDTLGAASAALIAHYRADDLVGFRGGFLVPVTGASTCCQVAGFGRDYSNEIYTADLKFGGLARRLGVPIGPLKYLLFSVTYGSKGYPYALPEDRERQVGLEVGLNLQEILNDIGVTRDPWWGYALHMVADNIRFPFTAVGFRYDLNSGRWCGPDNGNKFCR